MYSFARSSICRSVGVGGRRILSPTIGRLVLKDAPTSPAWAARRVNSTVAGNSSSTPHLPPNLSSDISTAPSTPPPPPPEAPGRSSLLRRTVVLVSISTLCFFAGLAMATQPVIADGITIAKAVNDPPTDEESLTLYIPPTAEVADIDRQIFSHPLTRRLLADPRYTASRPHMKVPAKIRAQTLTGGILLGPDKIALPPLQFTTEDGSTYVSLQYLGESLCGHPGIVHGGLLATLLDEGTARCCFPALPNKVAVTASLKIDYKKPTMAGQIVVLKAETTKLEGRKAWVKGRLESLVDEEKGEKPVVFAEAEALFIEPKNAASMPRIVPT